MALMKYRKVISLPKEHPIPKPEIYVMGNRNPYRISVDKKNNFLYWGEVGPLMPIMIAWKHVVPVVMMR